MHKLHTGMAVRQHSSQSQAETAHFEPIPLTILHSELVHLHK